MSLFDVIIRLMYYIHVNTTFNYIITLLHVSALKRPSSGSTDTFRVQGQQNECPDVNIRLMSSVLTTVM